MTATNRKSLLFLGAFVLLLLPFCFLGFGSDNDTYGVVDAGRSTWAHHHLMTSRNPGYWTYELAVFLLVSIGGFFLSNLASLLIAAAVLWRLIVLAPRLGARHPFLLASCLAVIPVFVVGATSTVDYLWSLLFIVFFVEALARDKPWQAMLFAALAISIRAANGVLIAGGFAAVLVDEIQRARTITPRARLLAVTGILSAVFGGWTFLFSAYLTHWTLAFTQAYMGPDAMWTLKMRAGRFIYKGLYLFGPLGTLLLATFLAIVRPTVSAALRPKLQQSHTRGLTVGSVGVLLGNIVLFWRYPIEVSYAVPSAFFLLLLLGGSIFSAAPRRLLLFALSIFSLNLLTISLAQPNRPGMATDAKLHLSFSEGTTIQDVRFRSIVRHCATGDCYNAHQGNLPGH